MSRAVSRYALPKLSAKTFKSVNAFLGLSA